MDLKGGQGNRSITPEDNGRNDTLIKSISIIQESGRSAAAKGARCGLGFALYLLGKKYIASAL